MNWVEETAAAAFGARGSHQVVDYFGTFYLFGGADSAGTTVLGDVWTSTDGVAWTEVVPSGASFSARYGHRVKVFDGRMYLIGGNGGGDYGSYQTTNDVWSTVDGVTWTEETAAAGFAPRMLHGLGVFENELWVTGGTDLTQFNDVWRSIDGVEWRVGFETELVFP